MSESNSSSTSLAPKKFGELKWGDVDQEEDNELNRSKYEAKSNNNNTASTPNVGQIRTVVEYVTNEKGQKLKVTRKLKSVLKPVKVNKHVLERRKWKKFGDCTGVPPGPELNVTYTSYEVINLDLRPKKRDEIKEESGLDKLASSSSIVVCRNCGETGHWTLKCPKRTQIQPFAGGESIKESRSEESESISEAEAKASNTAGGSSTGGKYVPLHLRNAQAAAEGKSKGLQQLRDQEITLRVTNLSEDTTEQDLGELFRRFGRTTRIFLAKDRQTGLSRGFAYVNFDNKADAQNALDKLNGHGYDNLILHVEWAKQRAGKGEEEEEGERSARTQKY